MSNDFCGVVIDMFVGFLEVLVIVDEMVDVNFIVVDLFS